MQTLGDFIIMTNVSNPAAMAWAKSKGWAASATEMWYSEAQLVTSVTGFMNNLNLISFHEMMYFKNCTTIEGRAFKGCANLVGLTLPPNVTNLSYETFGNCSSLEELTIPVSVTDVQTIYYVQNCTSLKKMTVNSPIQKQWFQQLTNILEEAAYGDQVTEINQQQFKGFTKLKAISFPPNLTNIKYEVFSNTDFAYMPTLDIPESVTTIGDNCFTGCQNLTNLILRCPSPSGYNNRMFGNSTSYIYPTNIYVPDDSVAAYKAKPWGNSDIKNRIKPLSDFIQ